MNLSEQQFSNLLATKYSGYVYVANGMLSLSPEQSFHLRKYTKMNEVNKIFLEKFWENCPYMDSAIQFRDEADQMTLSILRQSAEKGHNIVLILDNNTIVNIPATEFISITDNILYIKSTTKIYARTLKNRILAVSNVLELDDINIHDGWPASGWA